MRKNVEHNLISRIRALDNRSVRRPQHRADGKADRQTRYVDLKVFFPSTLVLWLPPFPPPIRFSDRRAFMMAIEKKKIEKLNLRFHRPFLSSPVPISSSPSILYIPFPSGRPSSSSSSSLWKSFSSDSYRTFSVQIEPHEGHENAFQIADKRLDGNRDRR